MRVVFDSNVIVAAFATHGICNELFEYCLRNTTILCSDFIAQEVERILVKKIKIPSKKTAELIRYLKDHTEWVYPKVEVVKNLRDINDRLIMATALTGQADYLITGDKDLLILSKMHKNIIISPRDFWIQHTT